MNIVIGIPHLGNIKSPTVLSLIGLIGNTPGISLRVAMQTGPFVHENRTKLVHAAQQAGASHLFFLDSDIACPDDTILRLLAHDRAIVGAMYSTRTWPRENTLKMPVEVDGSALPRQLFICRALGLGCVLIRMDVFDQVRLPWFDFERDEAGMVVTGEDVWFCDRAQRAGFDIWCDPEIAVSHIGDFAF